jgi:hypothetical protein
MDKTDYQTSSTAIDIPMAKTTHIVASTMPDGHTSLSSIVTDKHGQPMRRNSLACGEYGISPTYYISGESAVHTSRDEAQTAGSPVYGDKSRIFFSHNSGCSCKC